MCISAALWLAFITLLDLLKKEPLRFQLRALKPTNLIPNFRRITVGGERLGWLVIHGDVRDNRVSRRIGNA